MGQLQNKGKTCKAHLPIGVIGATSGSSGGDTSSEIEESSPEVLVDAEGDFTPGPPENQWTREFLTKNMTFYHACQQTQIVKRVARRDHKGKVTERRFMVNQVTFPSQRHGQTR